MSHFPEVVVEQEATTRGRHRPVPAVVAMHRRAAASRSRDGLLRLGSPRRILGDATASGAAPDGQLVPDRVLVAADPTQLLLGYGVLRVLEQPSNPWEAHGVVTNADELLRRIVALRPQVLIATTQVGEAFPPHLVEASQQPVRVLLLAEELNGRYEATLLRSGASGVLPFSTPPTGLVRATQDVLEGRTSVSSEAASIFYAQPRVRPLTQDRRKVLELLSRDLSIGQVARELGISESGVKSHISRIGKTTGITGVRALRVNARRLLSEDEIADLGLGPVVQLPPSRRSH
jgi:DNA-binding NarL/FixJ family response regulator